MIIAGIDPGINGSIAVLEDTNILLHIGMPKANDEIHFGNVQDVIEDLVFAGVDHVYIEKVHALFKASAKSTFNFGVNYGVARVIAAKFPYTLVTPKEWQKEVWKGITPIHRKTKDGKKKLDPKAMSLAAVIRLFPKDEFKNISKKTGKLLSTYDDGMIDATLIALYGYRMLTRK